MRRLLKSNNRYILALVLLAFLCAARWFAWDVRNGFLAIYDVSYANGFVSAGFLGSLIRVLNLLLPVELMTERAIYVVDILCLLVYQISAILLLVAMYQRIPEEGKSHGRVLMMGLAIVIFPMFQDGATFGCYDMFLTSILFISLLQVVRERGLFLLPILAGCGILIHPSFFLKYLPLILLMLSYRIFVEEKTSYKWTFIVTIVLSLILYLLSEVTSFLGADGLHNAESSLLPEWNGLVASYMELPIFCLLMLPYMIILFNYLKEGCESTYSTTSLERWYQIYRILSITLLPLFLMKTNYGILVYDFVLYYLLSSMALLAFADDMQLALLDSARDRINNRVFLPIVLLVYPVLFMPFMNSSISASLDFLTKLFVH